MRPITVEIVAYTPTEFFHCMHCEVVWHEGGIGQKIHAEQRAAALPAELAAEYAEMGCWAADLVDLYGDRIRLQIVDAVSIEGFFKTVRYRLGKLPAIVVDGRDRCDARDLRRATDLVAAHLEKNQYLPAGAPGAGAGADERR
jgi:hypothetical protein